MQPDAELNTRAVNAIRFLALDAIEKANSGHPGMPLGNAAVAFTLWTRNMHYNPRNPKWPNRDRFLLSAGHGSMLLYAMLHLTGYDLPMDEIKRFRQWGSKTPGHPESFLTAGVEVTTGPLGQGFANGVGMAIAEAHLAAVFNRPGHRLVDHYTYAIVSDGDLMEGVTSEAASIAGHLKLGKLIYMYDDNHISIEGSTDLAFTEDVLKRFDAYGWHTQRVDDLNDIEAIDQAVQRAKADPRPSLISVRTIIGYGLPHKQGTAEAHGEPAGPEEVIAAKRNLGWPEDATFYIPDDVLALMRQAVERGRKDEQEWRACLDSYRSAYPDLAAEFERRMAGELPAGWDDDLPEFPADLKGMATRAASGKVINALAGKLPELLGGSADLAPSTKTLISGGGDFQAGSYQGRNFHFGVREHGMGSAVNGMAMHGGLVPYGATFLVFSDYMRPAIRLSALSHAPSIWVYTHDSIGLGEDGPTHQPVEHLAALRAIPNLYVIRPADANEVTAAWKVAIRRRGGPTALALTRQNVPTIDRSIYGSASGLQNGAYLLADMGDGPPELILMASGSEVQLIIKAGERLAAEGVNVRLISFPCWELFEVAEESYRARLMPSQVKARVAVEAGVRQGWDRWVGDRGDVVALNHYSGSAPGGVAMEKMGFTPETIIEKAQAVLR